MPFPAVERREACESCKAIDVRLWHRERRFDHPQLFVQSWTCDGLPSGSILARTDTDAIELIFQVRTAERYKPINQTIGVVWTACRFGGRRPWFKCPGKVAGSCGRRIGMLYLAGGAFACRHCHNLAYYSQRETPLYRRTRKLQKLRRRLGGTDDLWEPLPPKPKGMHRKTYERFQANAYEQENGVSALLMLRSGESPD